MGLAAGLALVACTATSPKGEDTSATGLESDTSPADTDDTTRPNLETGTVGLVYAAELTHTAGRLAAGTGGAEWRGQGGGVDGPLLCALLGGWSETVAPSIACVDCTYTFALSLVAPELSGAACTSLGVHPSLLDGWAPAWGWAESAEVYPSELAENVLFSYYPPPDAGWEVVGFAGDGRTTVTGSTSALELQIPSGIYYYLPAP